ncbi:MAG: M14 family zinc carboxypeptidase [Candidatus Sumerlaeia bacterium]|nr:M14 family zinc carboxypeptidase [Candidatus Sumerlaeia bacterium]
MPAWLSSSNAFILGLVFTFAFPWLAPCAVETDTPLSAASSIRIDCDFPGGNIVLDSIVGDTVSLHQDLRDTAGNWFYWYFRVRGAEGRNLVFRFTKSKCIGVFGPAASSDGGKTWRWLGKGAFSGQTFRYAFGRDEREVRFCFAIPYVEANFREFLKRFAAHPHLKVDTLCRTKKGREVERLHVGRLDGKADRRVLLTCRHHCCEMMASYALEGIIEAVLAGDADGQWLCDHVEFLVVPFMDKDGVEDGDQGKNRKPHDHNRDYAGESLYESVRALRALVPTWSKGRLDFALDMHCPYISGQYNEFVYFVGGPNQDIWERVGEFSRILEQTRTGPIPYVAQNNLPFGKAWNQESGPLKSFARWAAELPGIGVATTIEIPYAHASGTTVTADTARALGRDLARAMKAYLQTRR